MNLDSQHNSLDQIAHYRQNISKARRLRNMCLRQTRRMWRQRHYIPMSQEIPMFMQTWWLLVEDLHTCAIALEDNYPPFLGTLRHYRERAQIQFTVRKMTTKKTGL